MQPIFTDAFDDDENTHQPLARLSGALLEAASKTLAKNLNLNKCPRATKNSKKYQNILQFWMPPAKNVNLNL